MTNKSNRPFTAGESYHQFKVIRSVPIPELQCVLIELIHEPSGAQIMHIANDDTENLFCLSFKTLPYNSNGVAHILEHTVLCGSKKFPVKDPFFSMTRRSLNTFMNALTGTDFTCYPAASQVNKDFYNLLDVYLDAVFHPNLNELSFKQEGHRLEFSDPTDPSTPLEYKGIVYNEMKGALSSGNARMTEAINETLFPTITYGHNSGGDPKVIPQLTYEELCHFHQVYYHPSRCLFFFYGNMPLEKHLDYIAEQTLNHTHKLPPLPPIPLQPRFKNPVHREISYPVAQDEDLKDKSMIAFGWLTCRILEQQEALALNILEIILMDTDASPLRKALLLSGLCKQANSFIDIELNEIPWGIVINGTQPESADALEEIIRSTLTEICSVGIPLQSIENAIHQLEFHRSEITGDHAPFGLSLFMRSGLLKQHGADPAEGLMIHSLFERLRKTTLEDPHYFSALIKKHFLNNSHFIRIIMKPDPHLAEHEAETEKNILEQIKASLTKEQENELIRTAEELATFQKEQEEEKHYELLPKVTLQDIPPSSKDYPLIQEQVGPLKVFHHSVFTNDIVYAELVFDLPDLPEEDLPYLRLLTVVMTQMGCNGRNYLENLDYIQENTGGINAGLNLNLQSHDHDCFYPTFHLRGKALHRNAPKLFSLLHQVAAQTQLDDMRRLKEVIVKHFNSLENRLNQSALKYAINLSAGGLNIPSKVANDLYGLNYYWKINEIVKNFTAHAPFLLEKLKHLLKQATSLTHPHLVLSCYPTMYDELKKHRFYGLCEMETSSFIPWKGNYPLIAIPSQGRIIASPVAFIGKVFRTVSYTHPDSPALNIAALLFDNLWLHAQIREQGGAYGGGAVSNSLSGNFYFYSYRDPNIISTLNAFTESVDMVIQGEFDDSDIEEAKLEIIQGLDSPIAPGSQADTAYGWWREGRTHALRQAFRNKTLALTKKEVIDAVERIIIPNIDQGASVIFAGKKQLEKANQQLISEGGTPLLIENI